MFLFPILHTLSSGVLQDHLGSHRPLLAHHRDNSGWISPREQVRPALSLLPMHILHFFLKLKHMFVCLFFSVKSWLSELVHLTCYRICARGLSATIHYHNRSVQAQRVHVTSALANKGEVGVSPHRENKPRKGGICVANHTSPIDVVILANDGCYAMVSLINRRASESCFLRFFEHFALTPLW